MRRVVPGGMRAALLILPLAALACRRAPAVRPPAEPRTVAERSIEVATVFETPEPYTARVLDPLDLPAFLARHPEYRADSAQMAGFYARRGRQFAWFIGDSLSAGAEAFIALAGAADSADGDGLGAFGRRLVELHDEAAEEGRSIHLCDSCATETELRLTGEFLRFAAHSYGGLVRRDLRELNWYIPRAKKDLARLMDSLAAGTMDLAAWEPVHPQFRLLRDAIPRLRAVAGHPWPPLELPRDGTLARGDSADAVRVIRGRLHRLGDLGADDGSAAFDSALASAVERFQERHGLAADGIVGPATARALDVPPAERLRTILVNIERLRWMPERQPPNALIVNIPEFRLHVFEEAREVMTMPIVVGAHATRTVIFTGTLTSMVLSPSWTVPWSITRKEILPALRRDSTYLARNGMEVIGGTAARPVIRQRPGAENPLGRVKFVFPNSFDIYMHDTPAKGLFEQDRRAFSHGCIRLGEARLLTEYLLRDARDWPGERIDAVMLGEVETTVRVPTPRPVLVVYFTAWVDAAGRLQFRDDIYGHDRRLAAELFR